MYMIPRSPHVTDEQTEVQCNSPELLACDRRLELRQTDSRVSAHSHYFVMPLPEAISSAEG